MENVKHKKIIFLVTQSEMGGAQRYIYEVSKALAERHEILVAAGEGDGELFDKISKSKIQNPKLQLKTQKLKYLARTPNPYVLISAIAEIRRVLKEEKPDVLFLCSTTAGLLGSIAGGLASRGEAKPPRVIYRIGGWAFRDPRPGWKNWLIFWAEKLTARFKDLIIVNSEYDWRIAVEKKIASPEKIIKICNGLDIDSLNFLPREEARQYFVTRYRIPDTGYQLIGCVANFYKTKGLEYLIESARLLNTKYRIPDTKYIVIGEGKERPKLEALIKKHDLENQVILAGRMTDAYRYLKAFDIFVLPSLKEGFPWVILEAMAAELPIVATNIGALPEVIDDGLNGCLTKSSDSQALAEKIKWLMGHAQEAKVMGIEAKLKLVKKFSLQDMIESTEKAIQANQ